MEEEVSVLSTLLESVSTVLSNLLSWISSATTSLIANPAIQLMFGISMGLLAIGFVVRLVLGRKRRKTRK